MPLEVAELEVIKEYIESAPSCRVFYRANTDQEGRAAAHVRIMAGQLSWSGKLNDKELGELLKWVREIDSTKGRVIEVKGWVNTQEVFG